MITTPSRFVGRREELNLLARRMDGAQPTSVNVVGERRIGKSSLLYHFMQTWEQRVDHASRFVVVYLDLQAKTPPTEAAFYKELAWALKQRPAVQRVDSLHQKPCLPLPGPTRALPMSWNNASTMSSCRSSVWMSSRSCLRMESTLPMAFLTGCAAG